VRSSIIVNAREEVVFTIPFSCFLISLQDFSHGGLSYARASASFVPSGL
jgi:hypothetical protein